ncbi:MAG TPA: putative toxin-antitoxin system toxin component, PIN family [Candidatus Angelobacter sp.]|jgi:putative PIN family toxin of toxin-antitoxin system|nr:putative toxin-antitoxin system toxin component, PIN family [Candidatus Angelobacter sp.]
MLLILDTNILLSGLLSPLGAPAKLLDAWERKIFTLVACDEIITEFRNVVSRPFFRRRLRDSAAELLAADVRDFSLFFEHLTSSPLASDPKDSYLLALAETSQAEFLVTGDKALLALKKHKSTRIISPAMMVELLKNAEK